jgi:hypothetical protein
MSSLEHDFRYFLRDYEGKEERKRTVNVNESLHSFYKNVAATYDFPLSTLIQNILAHWKDEHQELIKEDLLKRIQNGGL